MLNITTKRSTQEAPLLSDIDELTGWEGNPRDQSDESAAGLRRSIHLFGDISGIVFNIRTNRLVCGHQRVKQLRKLGAYIEKRDDDAVTIAVPGTGDRFSVRVVDWDEPTERQANVTANNQHIAGVFTEQLDDILLAVQDEITTEDWGLLQFESLMPDVPEFVDARNDRLDVNADLSEESNTVLFKFGRVSGRATREQHLRFMALLEKHEHDVVACIEDMLE